MAIALGHLLRIFIRIPAGSLSTIKVATYSRAARILPGKVVRYSNGLIFS
jgi:hypothetical protein